MLTVLSHWKFHWTNRRHTVQPNNRRAANLFECSAAHQVVVPLVPLAVSLATHFFKFLFFGQSSFFSTSPSSSQYAVATAAAVPQHMSERGSRDSRLLATLSLLCSNCTSAHKPETSYLFCTLWVQPRRMFFLSRGYFLLLWVTDTFCSIAGLIFFRLKLFSSWKTKVEK